jgi:glycosyltransferase involved in cell wall biosynthesis
MVSGLPEAGRECIRPMARAETPCCHEHVLVDPFVVLYAGNMGEHHDLETLVRAAAAFDDDGWVVIIGAGDPTEDAVSIAESLGARSRRSRYFPFQPKDDRPYSRTAGDVFVLVVQSGLEGVCVSSGRYTAMAAGTPIIAIPNPTGNEGRGIEACDAAPHVPQVGVDAVVAAIRRWRADPERSERRGTTPGRRWKRGSPGNGRSIGTIRVSVTTGDLNRC